MKPGSTILSYLLPRLQDILFLAVFAGVVGLGPRLLNMDGDLGRHLTIGGYILDQRAIPTRDLFSHSMAGEALTPHEWLAQVSFALAYRLLGLNGVVLLCAFLLALTITLVYRQALRRSGMVLVALGWSILAAAASSLHWLARPHLLTLLLVVVWTGQLESLSRGEHRRWWIFPILMLLWANLHGAFVVGFVIWGIYIVDATVDILKTSERSRRSLLRSLVFSNLMIAGSTSLLASLLNPSGIGLWRTAFEFLGSRYLVGHTVEYLPPNFQDASAWPFLLMLVLSLLLLPGASTRSMRLTPFLILAAWTAMALVSARNVPLYALLAAPVLAEVTAGQMWLRSDDGSELNSAHSLPTRGFVALDARLAAIETSLRGWLWPVIVVLLLSTALARGITLDSSGKGNRFDPAVFPVDAVDWLERQNLPQIDGGRVFNYFPWGGYLLYRLWPEQRVFIDGQTDFYRETFTRKYERVITVQDGWQAILRAYDVTWVLMPPDSALAGALRQEPGWTEAYRDGTASLWIFVDR